MVAEEHRAGLYVAIPIYFLVLAGSAVWAYKREQVLRKQGHTDEITNHYLGGRNFGPVLTAGTIFASLFSGYTVVGIPNEAFRSGWFSLRWLSSILVVVAGYFGTGLRLRKAGLMRNHASPVDFITDRFQSQLLRYTLLVLQTIPTVIYLAAQVIAIKGTFNSIFELDPDTSYPVIIIMGLILIAEWVGGLHSVALTDSVQGFVMLLSFTLLPICLYVNFGGWHELDPSTYPKPEFYQTLTIDQQWDFWQFTFINISFFTLPHLMQRTYAARNLQSLKAGYTFMTLGSCLLMPVAIYMGTIGVQIVLEDDNSVVPASPFTAIVEELMDVGGISKAAGIVAITSSLAGIMSTADSLIIAISQLITVEIIYPLRPSCTPTQMSWIGKAVSLCSVGVSLLIGLMWDDGLSDLAAIQFPLSLMAAPAFFLGLYYRPSMTTMASPSSSLSKHQHAKKQGNGNTNQHHADFNDVHPWSIAIGGILSTIFIFGFYFGYVKVTESPEPIHAGAMGFAIQLVVIFALESGRRLLLQPHELPLEDIHDADVPAAAATSESPVDADDDEGSQPQPSQSPMPLLFPGRPAWDVPKLRRFGDVPLSSDLLTKSMEGVKEPFANPTWLLMLLFSLSMLTPWTAESQPPLQDDGTFSAFAPPTIIDGLPWWAFKILVLFAVPTLMLLVAILQMPNEFPTHKREIAANGIDPNLVELTPNEMGRRETYDEPNILIHARRSSIQAQMKAMGFVDVVASSPSISDTSSDLDGKRADNDDGDDYDDDDEDDGEEYAAAIASAGRDSQTIATRPLIRRSQLLSGTKAQRRRLTQLALEGPRARVSYISTGQDQQQQHLQDDAAGAGKGMVESAADQKYQEEELSCSQEFAA